MEEAYLSFDYALQVFYMNSIKGLSLLQMEYEIIIGKIVSRRYKGIALRRRFIRRCRILKIK